MPLAGPPPVGKIFPGDRKAMKAYFVQLWGLEDSHVQMIFNALPSASSRRRLAATSYDVKATGFFETAEGAEAGKDSAAAALATPEAASTALGVTVTEAPTAESLGRLALAAESGSLAGGSTVGRSSAKADASMRRKLRKVEYELWRETERRQLAERALHVARERAPYR